MFLRCRLSTVNLVALISFFGQLYFFVPFITPYLLHYDLSLAQIAAMQTALLWAAPVVLLVLGGVVAFGVLRRRPSRDAPAVAGLTDKERAELDRILSKPG